MWMHTTESREIKHLQEQRSIHTADFYNENYVVAVNIFPHWTYWEMDMLLNMMHMCVDVCMCVYFSAQLKRLKMHQKIRIWVCKMNSREMNEHLPGPCIMWTFLVRRGGSKYYSIMLTYREMNMILHMKHSCLSVLLKAIRQNEHLKLEEKLKYESFQVSL
jgi:hypothetical protein